MNAAAAATDGDACISGGSQGEAWQRVHDELRDRARPAEGRSPLATAAVIDSPTVRGADVVPDPGRGYGARKKADSRKRHIAVDVNGVLPIRRYRQAHEPAPDVKSGGRAPPRVRRLSPRPRG
ncbi:hypothetical protein GCM10011588_63600 [Nocardia jinanensis]|uniref:Transposase IS4-like domain-containing protein n=1 Tax=Nocardia jinanensis TaxID=382504 RepID=A0A917VYS8_9NOCA|nr:hypothetical protein GCM10011588_63600 [Nocardia jinanensis]